MRNQFKPNLFVQYVRNVSFFGIKQWCVYILWVGLMLGLLGAVLFFLFFGKAYGVIFPGYVWSIPVGVALFTAAIAVDTIGHLTIYKEAIRKGEILVHRITIFAGITSTVGLCCCYNWPGLFTVPTLTMIVLSILYSFIDEALHWTRYLKEQSDSVEMYSHFFILWGHLTMISAWTYWFSQGYPGVDQTLKYLFA